MSLSYRRFLQCLNTKCMFCSKLTLFVWTGLGLLHSIIVTENFQLCLAVKLTIYKYYDLNKINEVAISLSYSHVAQNANHSLNASYTLCEFINPVWVR